MEAIINSLSEHLNSAVFVLLVVLAVSYWLVHKVSTLIAKWEYQREDLSILKNKWDDDIPLIKSRVDLIFQKAYPHASVDTSSPTHLTKTGEDISRALHTEELLKQHRGELIRFVEEFNPQNAYDLQQACFAVVEQKLEGLLSEEQLRIAKDKSFEYGIPLDNALAVVAVLLRDLMMEEKGWTRHDVA